MKGVILAGGSGSRLKPTTNFLNKHMILIYDKPMIWYPVQTLIKAGIKDIVVVLSEYTAGQIISYLKDGTEFGLNKLSYAFQENPGGIAEAILLTENLIGLEDIAVILGDNTTDTDLFKEASCFQYKTSPIAKIFLKKVEDPSRFGVPKLEGNKIIEIKEKPNKPDSDYAVTGLYFYDNNVFNYIKELKPSERGELEVTDLNNLYIKYGVLEWSELDGFWSDAGTFDSLFKTNEYWYHAKKYKTVY